MHIYSFSADRKSDDWFWIFGGFKAICTCFAQTLVIPSCPGRVQKHLLYLNLHTPAQIHSPHTHSHTQAFVWQLWWNLVWFNCNTLLIRPPPPNKILLYCTPQLYDELALPDFTVFSCQREPEPVFSHQIVSNTERAHCAEQKASPVLSLCWCTVHFSTGAPFFSPQPIGILRYDLMSSFMSCWGPCPKKNCFSNPLETQKISHIFITVGWRTQSWE